MQYVIVLESRSAYTEYFTGGRYIYQGDVYATLGNRQEAKRFKSAKVAQRSADSLNERSAQPGIFIVSELDE
ncbi:hypothetical protein ACG0Z4_20825 [Enterocloster aldenensis]|uniref:hypothetical protein n=1 Tax=Enterocloster aldenensis TaxID=358742 RepID=UPI00402A2B61